MVGKVDGDYLQSTVERLVSLAGGLFSCFRVGWDFFHGMEVYNNSSSLGQVSKANARATTISCHFTIYHLGHLLLTKRRKELSS